MAINIYSDHKKTSSDVAEEFVVGVGGKKEFPVLICDSGTPNLTDTIPVLRENHRGIYDLIRFRWYYKITPIQSKFEELIVTPYSTRKFPVDFVSKTKLTWDCNVDILSKNKTVPTLRFENVQAELNGLELYYAFYMLNDPASVEVERSRTFRLRVVEAKRI